jgi:uncharacterized protein YdhG (YjbR/CyaY superfamily)
MKAKVPNNVDEYIASFPDDVQAPLRAIRATIRKAAPAAEECISYRIPTFTLDGRLVYFAAFKNHIGFYPRASAIAHFHDELAPYKRAKGSVQFAFGKPMPLGLIARVVKFRVKQNRAAATAKAKS